MNRLMQWVMGAALICSSTVFTGCSKSGSDDVQEPVVKPDPVVNPDPDDNGANSGYDGFHTQPHQPRCGTVNRQRR